MIVMMEDPLDTCFTAVKERAGVKGSFRAGIVFLMPKRNDPRDTHWEEC